jgi:hypothetical protein
MGTEGYKDTQKHPRLLCLMGAPARIVAHCTPFTNKESSIHLKIMNYKHVTHTSKRIRVVLHLWDDKNTRTLYQYEQAELFEFTDCYITSICPELTVSTVPGSGDFWHLNGRLSWIYTSWQLNCEHADRGRLVMRGVHFTLGSAGPWGTTAPRIGSDWIQRTRRVRTSAIRAA